MSSQAISNGILSTDPGAAGKRVAIICDYLEEGWPSMDLVGETLFDQLCRRHPATVRAVRIRPRFVRVFSHLPMRLGRDAGFNADRFLNRLWYYPRRLRECRGQFDLFHLVDHSYSQLVRVLPAQRTIVTCHDLDTFRCLLEPEREPRPLYFRAMVKRILAGFRQAAKIICDSRAVRDQILAYGLLPSERLMVIPNGVHPVCSPRPDRQADAEAACLLGRPGEDTPCILHVGSTRPRKRIDLLLRIFAALRGDFPKARLIQVGGALTTEQANLAAKLGLEKAVQAVPFVSGPVLAAIYRRAALVLLPSEAEGFGLPVVEAMACGTAVVATDLPVLREVGGDAATYYPLGEVAVWSEGAGALLREQAERPDQWQVRRQAGLAWASAFSWAEYTNKVVELYRELLS